MKLIAEPQKCVYFIHLFHDELNGAFYVPQQGLELPKESFKKNLVSHDVIKKGKNSVSRDSLKVKEVRCPKYVFRIDSSLVVSMLINVIY